jgi:Protein of unknown function (DUF2934)
VALGFTPSVLGSARTAAEKRRHYVKTPPTSENTDSRENLIRLRAYELYERRGSEAGHELDDWLQAEAEVLEADIKASAA